MNPTQTVCSKCGSSIDANLSNGCPVCQMQMALVEPFASEPDVQALSPAELSEKFTDLEVLELIGTGGMGAVYTARQKKLDRIVALKVVREDISQTDEFAQRFEREAKALARLNHTNIVSIFDFGNVGDTFYYLMEYVDGTNLAELGAAQQLSPSESLAIVTQICKAIQFAHENGVVHRDIKPTNILLNQDGVVKIADFGLAKLCVDDASTAHLTHTRQVFGTPRYMAPEQIESSKEVDHRADIYSLGVVFYELLTGELPLGRFDPPSKKIQVDVQLDEIVLRALEKHPERRYQAARDFETDISRFAQSQPVAPVKTIGQRAGASGQLFTSSRAGVSHPSWHVAVVLLIGALFIVTGIILFVPALTASLFDSTFDSPETTSFVSLSVVFLLVGMFMISMGYRYRISQLSPQVLRELRMLSPVRKILGFRTFGYAIGMLILVAIGLPWHGFGPAAPDTLYIPGIQTWIGLGLTLFCAICLLVLLFVDLYEGPRVYFSVVLAVLGGVTVILSIIFITQQPNTQIINSMIRRSHIIPNYMRSGTSAGPILAIISGNLLALLGFLGLYLSLRKPRTN